LETPPFAEVVLDSGDGIVGLGLTISKVLLEKLENLCIFKFLLDISDSVPVVDGADLKNDLLSL
jgi:hypothetical protein